MSNKASWERKTPGAGLGLPLDPFLAHGRERVGSRRGPEGPRREPLASAAPYGHDGGDHGGGLPEKSSANEKNVAEIELSS